MTLEVMNSNIYLSNVINNNAQNFVTLCLYTHRLQTLPASPIPFKKVWKIFINQTGSISHYDENIT